MIASKLENVQWGEYTDLEAQINCVSDLLEKQLTLYQPIKSGSKMLNLCGTDLPLSTNQDNYCSLFETLNGRIALV